MKVLVLAERPGAAEELCAGARAMGADEVALVAFGDMEMPPSCADLIYRVTVPEGLSLDNATATVNAIFDHVRPDVVLVEPTRHMRILAGALAFHGGTSAIADVMELDGDVASSMYYGGAAILKRKPGKTAIYLMQPGAFGDSVAASGANQEEPFAWVDPGATVRCYRASPSRRAGSTCRRPMSSLPPEEVLDSSPILIWPERSVTSWRLVWAARVLWPRI